MSKSINLALAQALIGNAHRPKQRSHWLQALGDLAQAGLGYHMLNEHEQGETAKTTAMQDALGKALRGENWRGHVPAMGLDQASKLAMLAKALSPEPKFQTMTPEQVQQAGYAPGSVVQIGPRGGHHVRQSAQAPKPPTVRRFLEGNRFVEKQFDPQTNQWTPVSSGPRYKPGSGLPRRRQIMADAEGYRRYVDTGERVFPGVEKPATGGGRGLTPVQQRGNQEIDAARKALASRGLTQDQIKRASQKMTDTGRDNPHHDPSLERLVSKALRRKIGDDPEYDTLYQSYRGKPQPAGAPAQTQARPITEPQAGAMLRPDVQYKADTNAFTEQELVALKRSDPEQFEALRKYLEGGQQ